MLELFIVFIIDLLAFFLIYLILNTGLNIELGYTGIPNFGTVFWFSAGGFAAGALASRLGAWLLNIDTSGIDFIRDNMIIVMKINNILEKSPLQALTLLILIIIIAGGIGAMLGAVMSIPTVRLRSDYLAITFLAFGEILNVIGTAYTPLVGGPPGIAVPDVWAWSGKLRFTVSTLTILIIAIIFFAYAEYLVRTPLGRSLRVVRDNEVAAEAYGKDIARFRLISMIIGSTLMSVAGALYVLYSQAVNPSFFRFHWTFLPWLMILLGGVGNNIGVLLGTFIYNTIYKLIVFYKFELGGILPFDVVWLNYILLGALIIIILIYRPQGLLPEKPPRIRLKVKERKE
ncbi:MAG: branched-chain amino acid ABC transporter permease [Thermoproteota archaeon]|jgi:branched-chain amino acid transport system permease protein|uniref:Branched-chain amino acid ABC transporter permease n=1 Tax=Candidatus Methanodesulfokora washburnensis TaxID=2478471 RepID=A0A520KP69_9CREN|nr:MAG: branched-chain amino acid ABC transporter permease [Candidatus Methanodesulfokores washburnensis]TDA40822.1 MAG: branched-chain amino acid ABC transporter permease [Candidatus Korarchaeota archaeon]